LDENKVYKVVKIIFENINKLKEYKKTI